MHRLVTTALAAATALAALALPAPVPATAATVHRTGPHSALAAQVKGRPAAIRLTRSAKGVQPGIAGMTITARGVKGKVRFVVKSRSGKVKQRVKAMKGRAVYQVPPLGTGTWKVTATAPGKRPGRTRFEVYDSLLSVNSTTFTYSLASRSCVTQPHLTGTIKFKGEAVTSGFVDIYQDAQIAGGRESPGFLTFAQIQPGGFFDASNFVCDVVQGAGGTTPKGVGTWSFNVYYTDGPEYADYISSSTILVSIVA